MRSLRSFEVEPWLRSAGQQVWTRLRRGLGTREEELHATLQQEVEQLRGVRTNVQRATQLARVLDAVYALAEAHDLSEAQVSALRDVRPAPRVAPVVELARKLERSAAQVIEQMLGGEPAPARAAGELHTQLSVRADGYGLEALVSWLMPLARRPLDPAYRAHPAPSTPASRRTDLHGARKRLTLPAAALATRVTDLAAELRLSLPTSALATRMTDLVAELRLPLPAAVVTARVSDLAADVRLERAGVDAARASLLWSPSELSLRLRITQQAALDAVHWWSDRSRAEIALWLLSRGTQLVLRKWVLPQLVRGEVGPQLLLRVALASGATASLPLRRLSLPVSRAAARVSRVRRAVSPRRLLGR